MIAANPSLKVDPDGFGAVQFFAGMRNIVGITEEAATAKAFVGFFTFNIFLFMKIIYFNLNLKIFLKMFLKTKI